MIENVRHGAPGRMAGRATPRVLPGVASTRGEGRDWNHLLCLLFFEFRSGLN